MQIWFPSNQKSINQSIQISKEILWLQALPIMDQINLGVYVFHTVLWETGRVLNPIHYYAMHI